MNTKMNIPLLNVQSEHCALIIDEGLSKLTGVLFHKVEFNNEVAKVEYDSSITSVSTMVKTIRDLGYDVVSKKEMFTITGMSCASCANSSETILASQIGVINAAVNYANGVATVEYFPEIISAQDMKVALQSIGYDMLIEDGKLNESINEIHNKVYTELRNKTIWSIILSVPIVIIGMFLMDIPYANYIMMILSMPVVFWFGRSFFINAYKQTKHKQVNMDTLVALSTGIAFLFSTFNTFYPEFWHSRGLHPHVYFEAASVVIAFILLGKILEERAKSNTSSAIKKLIGLQPKTVIVIHDGGHEMEMPISKVKIDDVLLVKSGDKIPVDGQLIEGNSFVDESMISGESMPVEKSKDDKIFAGTINQTGSFKIKALKVGGDTVLAQIIKMVQEAQGSKAPMQKTVDKIAGVFVPIVLAISLLSFVLWLLLGGENAITQALLSMVTVLVIACPCALGLATPTAIMVGMGKGAEKGILIKDAESLELSHKVNAIVLDKTGTITKGKPVVTDFIKIFGNEVFLEHAGVLLATEMQSSHPLALAVVEELRKQKINPVKIESIETITGKGVKSKYGTNTYYVGNVALMKEAEVNLWDSDKMKARKLSNESKTVIYFSVNSQLVALIAIADEIKETSANAIQILEKNGIEVYMLTGDNQQTATTIAEKVGIKHFQAEVLPSEKAQFVKHLQSKGKVVAMVGDGINDSHALAQADVSIAMGKGSDIAIDVAKMTIISSDLLLIPQAFRLSKLTVGTIKQNLFWAFIYNIIGIPIAAGILYPINGFLLNPMIAGAAMALSSVSVVSNSLLLKLKSIN